MHQTKVLFSLFILGAALFIFPGQKSKVYSQCAGTQYTVILSLDGFRWDYPVKISTPNLNQIAVDGVKAVSLIPSFPSKTFPNHYTIATGLFPDHHGIVNNSFYDPNIPGSYSMSDADSRFDPVFYGGEPIWITAKKQGLLTASFYWVGSDVPIQGTHPDLYKTYDRSIPFIQRIDTIIKWLSLSEELRPRLILAYYEEPDGVGHDFGPDDPRTLKMIHGIDSLTGILYKRIKNLPCGECINFIVVSDHGMGSTSTERNIILQDFIKDEWQVRIEGGNPNYNLYASGQWIDSAYQALKNTPHIRVWLPQEVPDHLDYGKNPRTGCIILVADSAWTITEKKPKVNLHGGAHGYDIRNTDMHAIFYASGPAFKENYIHPSFQNIHIYPLLSKILGILPAPTDGNLNQVIDMLAPIK